MNKKIIAGGIATFVLGIVIGGASSSDAAATPTTQTITVPGPTKTVTNTIYKTPQACLDALDLTAQMGQIISDQDNAFAAAANQASQDGDIQSFLQAQSAAMDTATSKVSDITPQMATAASGCRAGS